MAWAFMSNHAHVLVCLIRDPSCRLRDVADMVGITERAVSRIVHELKESGVLMVEREGRRNTYRVDGTHALHHPLESHCNVEKLMKLLCDVPQEKR